MVDGNSIGLIKSGTQKTAFQISRINGSCKGSNITRRSNFSYAIQINYEYVALFINCNGCECVKKWRPFHDHLSQDPEYQSQSVWTPAPA